MSLVFLLFPFVLPGRFTKLINNLELWSVWLSPSIKLYFNEFLTSIWVTKCLLQSSWSSCRGAIWNRFASPRLMFSDHSSSSGCALTCLMQLSSFRATLTGRPSLCCMATVTCAFAAFSSSLSSPSVPVTWKTWMFSSWGERNSTIALRVPSLYKLCKSSQRR